MRTAAASIACVGMLCAPVNAGIVLISRTSTLTATRLDPDPAQCYSEVATSGALGMVTLTTPHADAFTSWASVEGIGGSFLGSAWMPQASSPFRVDQASSMEVAFEVVGDPLLVSLSMSGLSWPPGNVVMRITDSSGMSEILNAESLATYTGYPDPQTWPGVSWSGVLGPGSYRLLASAAGSMVGGPGGGQPVSGRGSFTFNLAFVPAPHVAAVMLLGALVRRRRAA